MWISVTMSYLKKCKPYYLALLMLSSTAFADIHFNKFWVPVTLNGNYDSFYYWFEPQFRFVEPATFTFSTRPYVIRQNSIFQQFLGNIAGGGKIHPEWILWLGQTLTTESQDAIQSSQEEYRAFQQLTWDHDTFYGIHINSRFRVEERRSLDFSQWAFRMRERIILNIPLSNNMAYEISDEALYNLNSVPWIDTTAWDQNRFYIAVVQTFSDNFAFAVGYMNQYLFSREQQINNIAYLNIRFFLPT